MRLGKEKYRNPGGGRWLPKRISHLIARNDVAEALVRDDPESQRRHGAEGVAEEKRNARNSRCGPVAGSKYED